MATHVFVPYSPRSFEGICADVVAAYPNAHITAMVIDGEQPPSDVDVLIVSRSAHVGAVALPCGKPRVVVATGGPTPLGVAAVLLAQRISAPLIDVQRDGIKELNTTA